jgi:hypothetical protein
VGRSISDYGPEAEKIVNKGGRGVKNAGRGILVVPAVLSGGRRAAKCPRAELATVLWMRGMRKSGVKVTTRIAKAAMKLNVRQLYVGDSTAQDFKASSGWMKRFMDGTLPYHVAPPQRQCDQECRAADATRGGFH